MQKRQSGQAIVYSQVEVKKWAETLPSAEQARPACCGNCGAASRPPGAPFGLVGHGLRDRQVRGPSDPEAVPGVIVIRIRRYRCRHCRGITTVLPRGLCARRHYSASAIGLALCLFGLLRMTIAEARRRVCAWSATFEEMSTWTTLRNWTQAIVAGRLFPKLRRSASGLSPRKQAERAAAALCAHALGGGSLQAQAFEGAALAA